MPYFGTQDTGLEAVASLRREDGLKVSRSNPVGKMELTSCITAPRLLQAKSSLSSHELSHRTIGDGCHQYAQWRPRLVSVEVFPHQYAANTRFYHREFSNSGPTNELYGQPSLVAPGGSILSTVPLALGGVDILSGTSMAAPYIGKWHRRSCSTPRTFADTLSF